MLELMVQFQFLIWLWGKNPSYKQTIKTTAYQLNWNEAVLPQNIVSMSAPIIVILVINSFPCVPLVQYLAATKSFLNMCQMYHISGEGKHSYVWKRTLSNSGNIFVLGPYICLEALLQRMQLRHLVKWHKTTGFVRWKKYIWPHF